MQGGHPVSSIIKTACLIHGFRPNLGSVEIRRGLSLWPPALFMDHVRIQGDVLIRHGLLLKPLALSMRFCRNTGGEANLDMNYMHDSHFDTSATQGDLGVPS